MKKHTKSRTHKNRRHFFESLRTNNDIEIGFDKLISFESYNSAIYYVHQTSKTQGAAERKYNQ